MARRVEFFKCHDIWANLDAATSAVRAAASIENLHDLDAAAGVHRLSTVLNFAKERIQTADPDFVQVSVLDTINSMAGQAKSEIDAFVQNQSESHVKSANVHADTILSQLAQLVLPTNSSEVTQLANAARSFQDSYESYRKKSAEALAALDARVHSSESGLIKLEKRIEEARNNLSTALSEFQSQFSTAQETRSQAFAEAQSSHQKAHAELVSNHSVTLLNQERETTRLLGENEKAHASRLNELNADFALKAQAILADIEQKKVEVEKLLGVIGTLGVSSGYKTAADKNRRTALVWQIGTVIAIVLLIGFAIVAFWPNRDHPFTWESLVARVFLTTSFGVLAAYCGFQGDRNQHMERRNRKIALEFEALGAYLDPLPEEQQHEFRLKLAELSFGKEDPKFSKEDRSPASMWDLIARDPELARKILEVFDKAKNPGT